MLHVALSRFVMLSDGSMMSCMISPIACTLPHAQPHVETGQPLELLVPPSINGHLRAYQRAGVQFLFRQYSRGKGGILADDMVSASASASHFAPSNSMEQFLVAIRSGIASPRCRGLKRQVATYAAIPCLADMECSLIRQT